MQEIEKNVAETINALVRKFSGQKMFSEHDLLYASLGMAGHDFIDFIEEVEATFGVDLTSISPRGSRRSLDPTVKQLTQLVVDQIASR